MFIKQIAKRPVHVIIFKLIVKNIQSHGIKLLFRLNIENGLCIYHGLKNKSISFF